MQPSNSNAINEEKARGNPKRTTLVVAITNNGARLGASIRDRLADCDLCVPAHRAAGIAGAIPFEGGVTAVVAGAFGAYDRILMVCAAGIAVRAIASCLQSKRTDPAVVVVDEKGQFAISLLSGHLGGANRFAKEVAELIGGTAVITTASDVNGTLAVDLLGAEHGWEIEDWANVTSASAAVVNGELIGVFQNAGENWWPSESPLPDNIRRFDDIADMAGRPVAAALVITDRLIDLDGAGLAARSVVYRPKTLVLGIGCNRGTSSDEIEQVARDVLLSNGLSFKSIRSVATIDVKRTEAGLIEFAARLGVPIQFYSSADLAAAPGIVNPSEIVRRAVGSPSVSEAAALLSAGASELTVTKTRSGNVAMAVARIATETKALTPVTINIEHAINQSFR